MKKLIIALLIIVLGIGGCSVFVLDKSLGSNVTVDGVYACTTGTYDPAEFGLSLDEYLDRQGISKTDEPSSRCIYVFATIHADEKKDLVAPYYENAGTKGTEGTVGPSVEVGGNRSSDNYYLNDKRLNTYFSETGYKCVTPGWDKIYAGSDETRKVVMCFNIGTKSLEENETATVDYGDYDFSFKTASIKKLDTPTEIAADIIANQ